MNVGGLVGTNADAIVLQSFTTGSIAAGTSSHAGGLVGYEEGFDDPSNIIENSYSTASVMGGADAKIGGFVGLYFENSTGAVTNSYATGAVSGGDGSRVGGFAGLDKPQRIFQSYWDTTTSGTDQGTGKGNVPGITGLTDEQLKSGLPSGFDPAIWAQDPSINNGYPYLIANPPRK
jgi:hypothetical protein